MTTRELLALVAAHSRPGDWVLVSDDCVRHRGGPPWPCPVCWVASLLGVNPSGLTASYDLVAPDLGLSGRDARAVAGPADNDPGADPDLRRELLAARGFAGGES